MKLSTYKNKIIQSIKSNKGKLGISGKIDPIKVSKLGVGENNLNFLIEINNDIKVIFRIGLRKEFEKNMKKEFETLKIVPKAIGPKPIYFDDSKKIIPHNYSVLSYLEGNHVWKWSKKHLAMHAKKLAELHKKQRNYCGTIYQKKEVFDLYKKFREDVKGFNAVLEDKDVKLILPRVSKYLKANNYLFTELKRFSLIHGDPCVNNILFTKSNVHYIDWEWTSFRDPSEDLARLYYEDHICLPWMLKLSGERLDFFISEYLKHRKDKTLKQRVKVWSVFLKFVDYLYAKLKVKEYHTETKTDLPKKHYVDTEKWMAKSLKKEWLNQ